MHIQSGKIRPRAHVAGVALCTGFRVTKRLRVHLCRRNMAAQPVGQADDQPARAHLRHCAPHARARAQALPPPEFGGFKNDVLCIGKACHH